MKERSLLAILPSPHNEITMKSVTPVSSGRYTAVFSNKPLRLKLTRRAALTAATERQKALEGLMGCGTVLPALPTAKLNSEATPVAIGANTALLDHQAERLHGMVQFQIRIEWDEDNALSRFLPSISGSSSATNADDIAAGLSDKFVRKIEATCTEIIRLPTSSPILVNLAILLPYDAEPQLDNVLSDIDSVWTEGLRIRVIGPSPAVSFCSIGVRAHPRHDVEKALRTLGLKRGASPDDVHLRRRQRVMSEAEGARDSILAAGQLCQLAARAGWPQHSLPELYVWSEDRAQTEIAFDMKGAA